jgi:hypothetical protein
MGAPCERPGKPEYGGRCWQHRQITHEEAKARRLAEYAAQEAKEAQRNATRCPTCHGTGRVAAAADEHAERECIAALAAAKREALEEAATRIEQTIGRARRGEGMAVAARRDSARICRDLAAKVTFQKEA